MLLYYNELLDEEKDMLTEVIKTLFNQTFLLESKFDKKSGRYMPSKLYRACERHLDFLKEYFKVADIDIIENRQYGIIFLKTQSLQGDKLSRLTTVFLLLFKLIYDEQMNTVSNSIHVYTTLNEIFDKIQLFRLWNNKTISPTEVRKTITALRKYQVIETLEDMGEMEGDARFILYPTVNLLFEGGAIQAIIEQYQEEDMEETEDEQISITDQDVFE